MVGFASKTRHVVWEIGYGTEALAPVGLEPAGLGFVMQGCQKNESHIVVGLGLRGRFSNGQQAKIQSRSSQ